MSHAPVTTYPSACTLPQGTVFFGTGQDQDQSRFLCNLTSLAIVQQNPQILRVNLASLSDHLDKSAGDVLSMLRGLQKVQVSVRTSHGEEFYGLVSDVTPVDHGDFWDIHLGGAGQWLIGNSSNCSWW